jgi:BirA family transcriptional regulator, biotin operon repressor / biotin---[acetyl-CoA-carboxylase] ligase
LKVELLEISAITEKLTGYWRVNLVDEISSTQTELKNKNPQNWDLLTAEFQSAGRGRLDRKFEAEKSTALLFSFYIKPKRTRDEWGFISLLAGAVVANTLNKFTHSFDYSCKWPNDILANDKKIAGLLSEVFKDGVIIGIGINVTMSKVQLPTDSASSILIESGLVMNRNILLADICNEFRSNYELWDDGVDFVDYYEKVSSTINKKVKAIQPAGLTTGVATGITKTGALLLDGKSEITVGDLIHLRD